MFPRPAALSQRLLTLTLPPPPGWLNQTLLIASLVGAGLALAWLPLSWAGLLLAGLIFFILLLLKPVLSIYILIPLIPFSSLLAVSLGSFKIGLMEIMLASGLLAWLLQLSTRHSLPPNHLALSINRQSPGPVPLLWPFFLLLAGVMLSWLNTFSIGASLVETAKWVEMLTLYLLMLALLSAQQMGSLVGVLLLTGAAQAVLGLYQFIFKVGPEGFLLFDGRFLRAYGTFAQPNPYAGYLGLILPLALALFIWRLECVKLPVRITLFTNLWHTINNEKSSLRRWHDSPLPRQTRAKRGEAVGVRAIFRGGWRLLKSLISNILLGGALALLLAALFASQSRAAWLAFACAALVTVAAWNRRGFILVATVAFIAVTVGLAGLWNGGILSTSSILQRFGDAFAITTISDVTTIEVNDANFATIERLAHWQAASDMWRDHPWLGVGFGNYAAIYPAYALGRWLDPLGHAHNYLLNVGAETGLVGITAYLIFWFWVFKVLWRALSRSHGFERAILAGGLGILVHLHVHNLFDNLYVQGMYLHVAIILALISIIHYRQSESIPESF